MLQPILIHDPMVPPRSGHSPYYTITGPPTAPLHELHMHIPIIILKMLIVPALVFAHLIIINPSLGGFWWALSHNGASIPLPHIDTLEQENQSGA